MTTPTPETQAKWTEAVESVPAEQWQAAAQTPDQVLTPEPFGTETEPAPETAPEPDPPIFAALSAEGANALPAADVTTGSLTQPEDSAPVHEYQVTHRIRQPGAVGSYSAYTTAWHAAEDAVRFVREHTF